MFERIGIGLVQFRPRKQFVLTVNSYDAGSTATLFDSLSEAIEHATRFYFKRDAIEFGGKPQYEHITIIDRWKHKTVYEIFTTLEV